MEGTRNVCPSCSSDNIYAEQLGPQDFAFGCNRCGNKFRNPRQALLNPKPVEATPSTPVLTQTEAPKRPFIIRMIRGLGEAIWATVFFAFIGGFLILSFTYGTLLNTGSMEPTMSGNDYVWLNPFATNFNRGDVVTFNEPSYSTEHDLLKRIVGLPSETILISHGKVYVNDRLLQEPWIPDFAKAEISAPAITLGPAEYYVLGDNRKFSWDSTEIGPVHHDRIKERVFLHLDLSPISLNFGDGLKKVNKSSLAKDATTRVIEANRNVPVIY